jgi:hypothetical protein
MTPIQSEKVASSISDGPRRGLLGLDVWRGSVVVTSGDQGAVALALVWGPARRAPAAWRVPW